MVVAFLPSCELSHLCRKSINRSSIGYQSDGLLRKRLKKPPYQSQPSLGAGGTSGDDFVLLVFSLLFFEECDFVDELDVSLLLEDEPLSSDDFDSSDGEADGD